MIEQKQFKNSKVNKIEKYWMTTNYKASSLKLDYKDVNLPLARIRRLMKVEEDVKMVSSEVPILFSKITEVFIEELTLRSWINTDECKRRILQGSDISIAIKTSDMYDFLIYIVPKSSIDSGLGKINRINLQYAPKYLKNKYIENNRSHNMQSIIQDNQDFMKTYEKP